MRLLKANNGKVCGFEEFVGSVPPYAILSHTWGPSHEEVSYKDVIEGKDKNKVGYEKTLFCLRQATIDNLMYFWIDTCCIDKANNTELSEAINSMFRWYRNAAKCYVYLPDVSIADASSWKGPESPSAVELLEVTLSPAFIRSRWFTRGWTLQELIAPTTVEFFCREGYLLGDRSSLVQQLHQITGISVTALEGSPLSQFSVEERMSWTALRRTTKEEDMAYCLLGIFDVYMPLIYAEGREHALFRLRREITEGQRLSQRFQEILRWLDASNPRDNYMKSLKLRQAGTGRWFLSSEQYMRWKREASNIWLHGIPGCGKTILSSTILENVLQHTYHDSESAVAYFYFDFSDRRKQEPERMIRSLVIQLSRQAPRLPMGLDGKTPACLDALYMSCENGRQPPLLEDLLKILQVLIENFLHVYIILDALDESRDLDELMEVMQEMVNWRVQGLHLLLTSRQRQGIQSSLNDAIAPANIIAIQSDATEPDIRTFVRHTLAHDIRLGKWKDDPIVQQDIEKKLMDKACGMFRWVACQLESLRKSRNERKFYEALNNLAPTLDVTYSRIILAIDKEDVQYALRVLRWLTFSCRPMRVIEVAEIMAIDVDRTPAFDRKEVLKDPSEVLDICSSLVTIVKSENDSTPMHWQSDGMAVTLAHYSVKENLISERIRNSGTSLYAMESKMCHTLIALSCVNYLQHINVRSAIREENMHTFRLAWYAAREWISHARVAEECEKITAVIAGFFQAEDDSFINWLRIIDPERSIPRAYHSLALELSPSPLYFAARFGLTAVAHRLINHGANVNEQVRGGQFDSALPAASAAGHEHTVQLLIEKGAKVNMQDGEYGETYGNALLEASSYGQRRIVQLLLDRGADVEAQSARSCTYSNALIAASAHGHIQVVQLLLERGAQINAPFPMSEPCNALDAAVEGYHEQTIYLLLDNGAVGMTDCRSYYEALKKASERGNSKLLEVLLDNGRAEARANFGAGVSHVLDRFDEVDAVLEGIQHRLAAKILGPPRY